MQIIPYAPIRDIKGRFTSLTSSIKKAYRVSKVVVQILIVLMAIWGVYMTKQVYNFKCSEGGYFTTKVQCDTFANAKFYEQELGRIEFIENNADIFGSVIKEAKANE